MKIPAFFSVMIILMFCSCQNSAQTNKKDLILGTWKIITDTADSPFSSSDKDGYQFLKNDICENKRGYFKRDKFKVLFLGTTTKYKIEEDSLKIYNPVQSKWGSMLLFSIGSDTLKLKDAKGKIIRYQRVHSSPANDFSFDQIIISTSGCFGSCPVGSTSISKSGEVLYHGKYYTDLNGYYTAKISSSQFKKLAKNFANLNIQSLKDDYASDWTDDETVTVSFINMGEIIKTISDYGRAAPAEFIWAYVPLRYLDKQLKLDSLVDMNPNLDDSYLSFQIGDQIMRLKKTESIYLWDLLRKAKKTNQTFQKKYKLNFIGEGKPLKIETDGQFFEYTLTSGEKITYNIGFNFIVKNGVKLKFHKKGAYDL